MTKLCLNCKKDITGTIPDYCNMACAIERAYKIYGQEE